MACGPGHLIDGKLRQFPPPPLMTRVPNGPPEDWTGLASLVEVQSSLIVEIRPTGAVKIIRPDSARIGLTKSTKQWHMLGPLKEKASRFAS